MRTLVCSRARLSRQLRRLRDIGVIERYRGHTGMPYEGRPGSHAAAFRLTETIISPQMT